jgi:hypothetical protein
MIFDRLYHIPKTNTALRIEFEARIRHRCRVAQ